MLVFRAGLGQSVFIQTAFTVQCPVIKEALWEQMEGWSNSNEPSFSPTSSERRNGTRPQALPVAGHFLFAVAMTTGQSALLPKPIANRVRVTETAVPSKLGQQLVN